MNLPNDCQIKKRTISLEKAFPLKGLSAKLTGLRGISTKKEFDLLIKLLFCGDGRTRTAVQTPHQIAFYTLSLTLVFDHELPSDMPFMTYPLNLGGG